MITAFELAGFFGAHAIWCVSDGEILIPMLAYTTVNDERKMDRLVSNDLPNSVAFGKRKLDSNEMVADDAALLYDGRIPLGNEQVDAIIIEIRAYFSPKSEAVMAVPYAPKSSGRFLVHKPKLLAWTHCDDFDINAAFEAFFDGVDSHEKGSKIWNECLVESK
jgi:hypothetical protein